MKKLRVFSVIILLIGIALVGYAGYNYYIEKKTAQDNLDAFDKAKEEMANSGEVTDDLLNGKNVYCKLTFQKLQKSIAVLNKADEETLKYGSGWLDTSKKLGENGLCVMMGHRDTTMNFLQDVEGDETIIAETLTEKYTYKVKEIKVVSPDDVLLGEDFNKKQLRLITCYPFSYFGSAPERYIITAELVE